MVVGETTSLSDDMVSCVLEFLTSRDALITQGVSKQFQRMCDVRITQISVDCSDGTIRADDWDLVSPSLPRNLLCLRPLVIEICNAPDAATIERLLTGTSNQDPVDLYLYRWWVSKTDKLMEALSPAAQKIRLLHWSTPYVPLSTAIQTFQSFPGLRRLEIQLPSRGDPREFRALAHLPPGIRDLVILDHFSSDSDDFNFGTLDHVDHFFDAVLQLTELRGLHVPRLWEAILIADERACDDDPDDVASLFARLLRALPHLVAYGALPCRCSFWTNVRRHLNGPISATTTTTNTPVHMKLIDVALPGVDDLVAFLDFAVAVYPGPDGFIAELSILTKHDVGYEPNLNRRENLITLIACTSRLSTHLSLLIVHSDLPFLDVPQLTTALEAKSIAVQVHRQVPLGLLTDIAKKLASSSS